MKKLISLILVMMLLLTASCGKSDGGSDAPSDGTSETETSEAKDPETKAPGEQTETEDSAEESSSRPVIDSTGTIEETVLVDEGGLKVTATELKYESDRADVVLRLENDSPEDVTFAAGSPGHSANSVNGFIISGAFLSEPVAAGESLESSVSFYYEDLRLLGIGSIAEIELGIYVTDSSYDTVLTKNCVLRTSLCDSYDPETDPYPSAVKSSELQEYMGFTLEEFNEDIQFESSGVKLLNGSIIKNFAGESTLLLEFINTSEDQAVVTASDFALNGILISSGMWSSDIINPGKRAVLIFRTGNMASEEELEKYGILDVETIECKIGLTDADGIEAGSGQEILVSTGRDAHTDLSGDEIYNENGIRIISKGFGPSSLTAGFFMLIENDSGETVTVDTVYDSVSLNGRAADAFTADVRVPDGKRAKFTIDFMSPDLDTLGITDIEDMKSISFTIDISNEDHAVIAQPEINVTSE